METGIHELTAGYALDALDPEERRLYEAHLAECARCREELTSFWQGTEALAVAASGPTPSPELRGRILASVQAEPQAVVPLEPLRRRRAIPVLGAAAAIAAVVALAVGLWASRLSGDLDDARAALERERAASAVLADPAARQVSLEAGDGRLVVGEDGRAVLVLDGLEPAPSGKTYEMWIIEGKDAHPAGLFPGQDGLDVAILDGTVEHGDVVAVTVEDAAGVTVPTSAPIVASSRI